MNFQIDVLFFGADEIEKTRSINQTNTIDISIDGKRSRQLCFPTSILEKACW